MLPTDGNYVPLLPAVGNLGLGTNKKRTKKEKVKHISYKIFRFILIRRNIFFSLMKKREVALTPESDQRATTNTGYKVSFEVA